MSLSKDTINALQALPQESHAGESLLRILQMLSIVGAGFWTAYLYVSYQERSNELSLVLSSLQATQTRLTSSLTRLDIEKRAIEVARARQSPVTLTNDVKAERLSSAGSGRYRYLITYNYIITNVSEFTLNVDHVIVRGFHAKTDSWKTGSTEVNDFSRREPLSWVCVLEHANLILGWTPKSEIEGVAAEHGSGGTGTAKSGESLLGGVDLLIIARPSDLIGFKVRLRIGRPGTEFNDPRFRQTIRTIQSTEERAQGPRT